MGRVDFGNFKQKTNSFQGIYRGVIEDNNDPEMLGRCRVRIWGLHTDILEPDELEGIPTKNLPWSEPCLGLLEGSISGNGLFSVPLQGSHVFLFFEGGNWMSPRYFATVPGQPSDSPDPKLGFNDPNGLLPRSDRLGEPDWHRLARGVTEETVVDWRNQNIEKGIIKADGETWDEPESPDTAVYPNNIVLSTHRGITIELDSTEGAERIHVYHPSNSYIEIDAVGNLIFRNDGNRFEITRGERNKHIHADDNETIDADKTSKIKTDETIDIGHDRIKGVGNDDTETIGRNRTTSVANNETKTVGGNDNNTVGGDWTITVTGAATINAASADITTSGAVTVTAGSTADVVASGAVTISGSVINLN